MSAATTTLTQGFSLTAEKRPANEVAIALTSNAEISSGSGAIALLRFVLKPIEGSEKHTAIELGAVGLFGGDGNPIAIASVKNGSCVVRANGGHPGWVYVDGGYAGTSDGSLSRPWQTIQNGVDHAKSGDTVVVAAGMYTGSIVMRSGVYLLGLGASVTTIEFPNDPMLFPQAVAFFNNVDGGGIEGFTLINHGSGFTVDIGSSNVTLSKNKIDNSGMGITGVIIHDNSRVTVQDNYFVQSENGPTETMSVSASQALIAHNVFSPGPGMWVLSLSSAGGTVVRNNRFYLNAEGLTGVAGLSTGRVVVANNLFCGNAGNGFGMQLFGTDSLLIANNVFDNLKDGIDDNNGGQEAYNNIFLGNDIAVNFHPSTNHQFNLFWDNKLKFGAGQQGPSEIPADPLFVDQSRGNYKLSPASPAINAGFPSSAWNDADGTRGDIGIFGGPYADMTMFASLNSRLRIANVSGAAGDTIIVPISAMGISGISGLKVLLTFDADRLSLLEGHTTPLTQDFVLNRKNVGNSLVELTLQGSRTLVIDSGAVITIAFVAAQNATGCAALKFQTIQLYGANTLATEGVAFENGAVTLGSDAVGPGAKIPRDFTLYQNFPNPFNPSTTIRYDLPVRADVQLKIFDILGREVLVRRNAMQPAGTHEIRLDVSALSSGTYFYQLRAGSFVQTKKMLIVK